MKRIITLILLIASISLKAQTYKTVTMALDTPTNVAILRAGVQSYNLTTRFGLKVNVADSTTVYRTFANSLSRAQIQTGLNLKLNLSGGTLTGDVGNTSTGFFRVASGTTAERPVTPLDGMIRYNSTTLRNEFYSNGAWRNMARLEGDTFTGALGGTSFNFSGAGTIGGNLAVTGTSTLTGGVTGNTNFILSGSGTSSTGFLVSRSVTGGATLYGGFRGIPIFQSDVTALGIVYGSQPTTQATAFTLGTLTHFLAIPNATFGSGSTVTTQNGFHANNTMTGATNNYGFRGSIASGTNRFNLFMDGTALNHIQGTTLFGTLTDNGVDKLQITGSGVFSTRFGIGTTSTSTFLNIPAGTTASSSFRMPSGVAPTAPVDGDFWRLTGRTQVYDGTQTKDVIFDKANSVFAGFGVGVIGTDNSGNLAVLPSADRTLANTDNNTPKTANYTIVLSDYGSNGFGYLGFNATSGNLTATLPTASTTNGLTFTIKKSDASGNTVTLSSAQNIDGVTTKVLSARYNAITVMSNGTTYNIISQF